MISVDCFQLVELIISSANFIVTGIIAMAGTVIAYKNTYGNSPVALVSNFGVGFYSNRGNPVYAHLEIEIWNNRKYPIQFRSMEVIYNNIDLIEEGQFILDRTDRDWIIEKRKLTYSGKIDIIESSKGQKIRIEAPVKDFDFKKSINNTIIIKYFDPYKAKHSTLKLKNSSIFFKN